MKQTFTENLKAVAPFVFSGLTVLGAEARNYVMKSSATAPNLIYIISDQLRLDALSCMGNKIISTPNMDRLANEGVLFTRAYAQSPVSVPSRSSMLTGNSLCNTGILGNGYAYETVPGTLLTGTEPIFSTKTYDEVLAENAYNCEYYGKWHSPERKAYVYSNRPITCAGKGGTTPELGIGLKQFYQNFWAAAYKTDITTPPNYQAGALLDDGHGVYYMPDVLDSRYVNPLAAAGTSFGKILMPDSLSTTSMDANNVIAALERNKNQKFSIHCSFGPPHPPFIVGAPYYGSLNAANMPIPKNYFVNNVSSPYYNAKELNSPYFKTTSGSATSGMGYVQDPVNYGIFPARYYEMVKEVDDKLGEILAKLDQLGIADNTMIVFTADHGEMLGSHGMDSKNVFFDESARVPLIIRYPAKIAAGKRIHTPVNVIDVRPTIESYLEMPVTPVDGKNLRPYIDGTNDKAVTEFAISEWSSTAVPGFMIRTDRYKLMFGQSASAASIDGFYDLKTDSLEQNNILKNAPTTTDLANAETLKVLLVNWLKKIKSPNYYNVKSRPVNKNNATASYTIYGNDTAQFTLAGVTAINTVNLPVGTTYKILPNDLVQIVTPNVSVPSTVTVTVTGPFTQTNGTVLATKNYKFEVLKNNFPVTAPTALEAQALSLEEDGIVVNSAPQQLSLELKNYQGARVQMYTTSGELMFTEKFTSNRLTINTSTFAKGVCLLQLVKANSTTTKKIIIQ